MVSKQNTPRLAVIKYVYQRTNPKFALRLENIPFILQVTYTRKLLYAWNIEVYSNVHSMIL